MYWLNQVPSDSPKASRSAAMDSGSSSPLRRPSSAVAGSPGISLTTTKLIVMANSAAKT